MRKLFYKRTHIFRKDEEFEISYIQSTIRNSFSQNLYTSSGLIYQSITVIELENYRGRFPIHLPVRLNPGEKVRIYYREGLEYFAGNQDNYDETIDYVEVLDVNNNITFSIRVAGDVYFKEVYQ